MQSESEEVDEAQLESAGTQGPVEGREGDGNVPGRQPSEHTEGEASAEEGSVAAGDGRGLSEGAGKALLVAAVAFGLVADALLRVTPWGLNVTLVVLMLVAAAWGLSRWQGYRLEGDGRWLVAPTVFFAGALAWRDSPTLTVGNGLALFVAILLAAFASRAGRLRLAGLGKYLEGLLLALVATVAGALPVLLRDVSFKAVSRVPWLGYGLAVLRGALLALLPVLVFGGLFAAADEHFEQLVHKVWRIDLRDVVVHVALAACYAWLFAGMVRETLLERFEKTESGWRGALGIVEVGTMLVALNVLFLTFVILQLRYLFGGVEEAVAVGFSPYARRGFFELVWVAGLTLSLLLASHAMLKSHSARAEWVFRVLAALLIGLLFVIMASAVMRMRLYVEDSGLTELRIQASAFMVWVAIVLVWFVLTVLRGQRQRFAFGALVSASLVMSALNVLNPDDLIVRNNAAHGHFELTGPYVRNTFASFSADATPAIVEALPLIDGRHRAEVQSRLRARWGTPSEVGWTGARSTGAARKLARRWSGTSPWWDKTWRLASRWAAHW